MKRKCLNLLLLFGLYSVTTFCMNSTHNESCEQLNEEIGKEINTESDSEENEVVLTFPSIWTPDAITTLKEKYMRLAESDQKGRSMLMIALDDEDFEFLTLLLQQGFEGIDINAQDKYGGTVLMYVALNYDETNSDLYLDLTRAFIKNKAKLDIKNIHGVTVLDFAIHSGGLKMVEILIDAGVKLDLSSKNTWTPLMSAASNGYAEIAELLISTGADLNLKSNADNTAFKFALDSAIYYNEYSNWDKFYKYCEIIKHLLFNNAVYSDGLHTSEEISKINIIKKLLNEVKRIEDAIKNDTKETLHEIIKFSDSNSVVFKEKISENNIFNLSKNDYVTVALCKHKPCDIHKNNCPMHCRRNSGNHIVYCLENKSLDVEDIVASLKTCNTLSPYSLKCIVSYMNQDDRNKIKKVVQTRKTNAEALRVIEGNEMVMFNDGDYFNLNFIYR